MPPDPLLDPVPVLPRFTMDVSADRKCLHISDAESDWSATVDTDDVDRDAVLELTLRILHSLNDNFGYA